MADLDQLYTALKRADAAGDVSGARQLAAYIKAQPTQQPSAGDPLSPVASGGFSSEGNIGQGILRGFNRVVGTLGDGLMSVLPEKVRSAYSEQGAAFKQFNKNLDVDNKGGPAYMVGDVGGQVLATSPVGPVLGAGVKALGATSLGNSIASAGLSTGAPAATNAIAQVANVATRVVGGAATGGASAALVDPSTALKGAAIGAVLPPVIAGLGKAGTAVANAWRSMSNTGNLAGAQALVKALDAGTPAQVAEIVDKLRKAETLVPGASPTVAQALQTPEAGILSRVVHDSPGGNALRDKVTTQNAARLNALEEVAATAPSGAVTARQDFGEALRRRVIPEEAAVGKRVSDMYQAVDPQNTARIRLPIADMQAAEQKYLGPGSFGQGADARNAIAEAANLSKGPLETITTRQLAPGKGAAKWAMADVESKVPTEALPNWRETQSLRASIGTAAEKAGLAGNKQEKAALNGMLKSLDDTVERLTTGGGTKGENFTPEMGAAWQEANASFKAKMDRFHTGPQADIFKKSTNGEPLVQGGEVAAKFWGNRPGLADDVKAFRRLVDDNPAMLGQFKSMVATEGAGTSDAAGNLTTKFSKWVEQTLPGLRETFTKKEVDALQRIAADIDRNAAAIKAGTSPGGSNTYQNASNALGLGFLDNPALNRAANMIPGVRYASGPALEGLRGVARNRKAQQLAAVLSDSEEAANAIERLALPQSRRANEIANLLKSSAVRVLPVAGSR